MKPYELFTFLQNFGHENFITSGDDVQWIVLTDDSEKVIRLIFEESDGKRDWTNNLKFPTKVYKKQNSCLKAARGWGDAYKSCNDEIMSTLIKHTFDIPDYEVQICGWSYGGAMCLLAAEDYHYRTGEKASVITFGAPKPLWGKDTKKYVQSCVKDVKQYTHVNDCIALLPPFIGYTRLSTDYIGSGKSLFKLLRPRVYHTLYGVKELY